jgi:hypothetical protein
MYAGQPTRGNFVTHIAPVALTATLTLLSLGCQVHLVGGGVGGSFTDEEVRRGEVQYYSPPQVDDDHMPPDCPEGN